MIPRHAPIIVAGAVLLCVSAWAGADDAAPRAQADAPQSAQPRAGGNGADPARLTWRVRRTQEVLAEHFADDRFRVKRSAHFVLLHNTDPQRAATRAALLDLTYQKFYEAFGNFYELDDAEHPLVCVLLADEEAFAHYARHVDRLEMSWAGGYYSSRTNRMVLYDDATSASQDASACAACAEAREVNGSAAPVDASEQTSVVVSEVSHDDAEALLLAAADEAGAAASPPLNLASTTHEAAHQLAFNTGLQRRGVMYPFWVSEGLACAFETNRPGEPFGLGKSNPTRLEDLRRAMDREGLIGLETFVSMTGPSTRDRAQLNAVYAQAWALFHFLYLYERPALSAYLQTLAALPAGRRSPEALRSEFVEAFGPIGALGQRWQAHLEKLR